MGSSQTTLPGRRVTAYATQSVNRDRYIAYYSYTGGRVLDYHFVVSWAYNGDKVVGTPGRGHYITSYTVDIQDSGTPAAPVATA